MEIKIETNVPLPGSRDENSKSAILKNTLLNMNVRESFLISNLDYRSLVVILRTYKEIKGKRFITRKEGEGHRRCWRVK